MQSPALDRHSEMRPIPILLIHCVAVTSSVVHPRGTNSCTANQFPFGGPVTSSPRTSACATCRTRDPRGVDRRGARSLCHQPVLESPLHGRPRRSACPRGRRRRSRAWAPLGLGAAIAAAADASYPAGIRDALGAADGQILNAAIGMVHEPAEAVALARLDGLLAAPAEVLAQ